MSDLISVVPVVTDACSVLFPPGSLPLLSQTAPYCQIEMIVAEMFNYAVFTWKAHHLCHLYVYHCKGL